MPFVKVLRHGQVTLPKECRDVLGIVEGQFLEVTVGQTALVLKPKVVLDRDGVEAAIAEGLKDRKESAGRTPKNAGKLHAKKKSS